MDTQQGEGATVRPPAEACDVAVGLMVETRYGWREYCMAHGEAFLRIYPDRASRALSLYEVLVSYRTLKCTSCYRVIWDISEMDPVEYPKPVIEEE